MKGLQVYGRGVQPRAEGCRCCSGRPRGDDTGLAGRAPHRQTAVLLDDGLHGRQVDHLADTDRFDRQVGRQHQAAVMATDRPVVDDAVGLPGLDSVVAFVPRLGPAGLRLLPLLLAVRRGRFG